VLACIHHHYGSYVFTLPLGGVQSIVMSMSVCLSTRITRKLHGRSSPIFWRVVYGRGSVLLRWHCDTLSTSGFCMTSCLYSIWPVGQNQAWRYIFIEFNRWQHKLDVKQLVFGWVHQNAAVGGEVYYLQLPCLCCGLFVFLYYQFDCWKFVKTGLSASVVNCLHCRRGAVSDGIW